MVKDSRGLNPDMGKRLLESGWKGDLPRRVADIEPQTRGQFVGKSANGFKVRSVLSNKIYYGDTPADAWADLWVSEPEARTSGE